VAADWPTLTQLKQSLNVNTDARDAVLGDALAAAIDQVKIDCASSPEAFDDASEGLEVTYSLSQAALVLAVMVVRWPQSGSGPSHVYQTAHRIQA
jgi:hypothetical protein